MDRQVIGATEDGLSHQTASPGIERCRDHTEIVVTQCVRPELPLMAIWAASTGRPDFGRYDKSGANPAMASRPG
jgi:hypothetical protein